MRKKDYELIEHTADIGIIVKSDSLTALFAKAALAMFDIIAEKKNKPEPVELESLQINLEAENLEELFATWLNELIYLYSVKELVFSGFEITELNENSLKASIAGDSVENYTVNTEIKAVTYHELEVKKTDSGWQARVIFDV